MDLREDITLCPRCSRSYYTHRCCSQHCGGPACPLCGHCLHCAEWDRLEREAERAAEVRFETVYDAAPPEEQR